MSHVHLRHRKAFPSFSGWPLLALLVCAVLVSAGCGGKKPARRAAASKKAQKLPADVPFEFEDEPEEVPYAYSPVGKRDPFERVSTRTSLDNPPMPRGPLQSYDLDALRLRFTVTGTSSPQAMIVAPNGKAYMVGIGDFVGKNWGKVSHIGREEIIVTETIVDPVTNQVFPVNLTMQMPKTQAEISAARAMDMSVEGEESEL